VFEAGLVDPTETYGDIEAPTLIVKADAEEAEREREREIAAYLPDGRIVHVDEAGHCVFWDERAGARPKNFGRSSRRSESFRRGARVSVQLKLETVVTR